MNSREVLEWYHVGKQLGTDMQDLLAMCLENELEKLEKINLILEKSDFKSDFEEKNLILEIKNLILGEENEN